MADLSQYLLYIPGAVIFLVETGQVREYRRRSRYGATRPATVISNSHVTKKDKYDRQVFDYFDTVVEAADSSGKKKERYNVKSPVEYAAKQKVTLFFPAGSKEPVLTNGINEWVINPWLGMLCGALLILLAMFQIKGNQIAAMICLSLLLLGAGAALTGNYLYLKKKNLEPVEGKVTGIYERQVSKPGRYSGDARFTYYPIVTYTAEGAETVRRCNINSGRKDSFKVGDTMTLYWSPSEKDVRERKASKAVLAAGIILLVIGILACVSILSVL